MDVALSVHFVGEVTGLRSNPIMMLLLCEGWLEGLETKGSSFRTGSAANWVTVTTTILIQTLMAHVNSLDDPAADRQGRARLFLCHLEIHRHGMYYLFL